MPLSIKNAKAERLARELAKIQGTNITNSVIVALEEAIQRATGRRRAPSVLEEINKIADRCSALPDLDSRSPDEILSYNEDGYFS